MCHCSGRLDVALMAKIQGWVDLLALKGLCVTQCLLESDEGTRSCVEDFDDNKVVP